MKNYKLILIKNNLFQDEFGNQYKRFMKIQKNKRWKIKFKCINDKTKSFEIYDAVFDMECISNNMGTFCDMNKYFTRKTLDEQF